MRDPRTDPQPGDTIAGFSPLNGKLYKVRVHFVQNGHISYGKWLAEESDDEPANSDLFTRSLARWIEQAEPAVVISVGREKVASV